jgi:hypothetical protein
MATKETPDPWDEIEESLPESDLPPFLDEERKRQLAEERAVLTIQAVRTGTSQYGEVWYVDCDLGNGEVGTITLSAGIAARDALIAAFADRVPIKARFTRRGPAYWFERP